LRPFCNLKALALSQCSGGRRAALSPQRYRCGVFAFFFWSRFAVFDLAGRNIHNELAS